MAFAMMRLTANHREAHHEASPAIVCSKRGWRSRRNGSPAFSGSVSLDLFPRRAGKVPGARGSEAEGLQTLRRRTFATNQATRSGHGEAPGTALCSPEFA